MTGVTIGQFNPPHLYHLEYWDEIQEENSEAYVGLLDTKESWTGPLTFQEREEIIESEREDLSVVPIKCKELRPSIAPTDIKYLFNPHIFKNEIQEKFPSESRIYTGDWREYWYYRSLGFDVVKRKRGEISGSEVRGLFYQGSDEWRDLVPTETEKVMDEVFPERYEELKTPSFMEKAYHSLL